jgi:hypothetical protein
MDNEKQQAEHLGSSDCSSDWSKEKAEKCVTHHYGCDCREYRFNRLRNAIDTISRIAKIEKEHGPKIWKSIARLCDMGLNK